MRYFVRLTDGIPTGWGIRPDHVPDGAVEVDVETFTLLPAVWWDGTGWQPRPSVLWFVETAEGLAIAGLPPDATVVVEDGEAGVVLATLAPEEDGSVDIELPDPGIYEVTVTAPLPWLAWSRRVAR